MKKKQIVSLVLAMAMGVSLCACGNKSSDIENNVENNNNVSSGSTEAGEAASTEAGEEASYDATSKAVYDSALGEFKAAYDATENASSLSEKFALQAVAEAKLLESAIMLPLYTRGGYYAISRVAPNTVDYTLWGNDNNRYHNALVVDGDPLKKEDRAEMKAKWAELKGTGTYEEWAKKYLADKGYKLKDEYGLPYSSDPTTWDVLATSQAADSEAIINTYDGLMEYDCEGTLQPALAEKYEVSDDGKVYTFHLRDGVKWVDSQGREVADMTADDFVAGFQHMMDAKGGLESLVSGIIVNAAEYIDGNVTDFAEVGVKALDDKTVEYTLCDECTYFTTMLGYGIFAPMSRSYYQSQGGKFGVEYDTSDANYQYGVDQDHIAYCGPYLVTNLTSKNTIVFEANDTYWNKDNINIKTIKWIFDDGQDPTKTYTEMKSGVLSGASLTNSTIETSRKEGLFDKYAFISSTDATSFMAFYNLNRAAFANVNDDTTVISAQTDEEKSRANAAMNNVHFRRAISFAMDRASYNAQTRGEELKYNSLRNSYTPGTFVSLEEDTTISINGTDTTFKAGTFYGEIVQAQVDADGVPMKVWDPKADDGIGSSDGFDGWYNVDNAVAELETAIAELGEAGVTVDESNPIALDLPYPSNDPDFTNKANAYKQSIADSLGGKVVINLVEAKSFDEWYYSGYYTSYGYEQNYDIFDLSGWGPDYGDPKTYLDTFLPDYAGYMCRCLGIY